MDNLPILEMDLGKRTSDLGTQFDAVDRRELAEQADLRVDVACERLAHSHLRGWHLRRGSLTASAIGEANPEDCRERYHRRAHHPGPDRGPRGGRPFAVLVERTTCDPLVNRHFQPPGARRGLGKNLNAAEFIEKLAPHRSPCPCCASREGKMITTI